MSNPKDKRLFIVDISSFIFRAFFAIRFKNADDGTPVNAVYGVMNMLMKLIAEHQPSHLVMARDLSGPSFRHEIYDEYKANRSAAPEELVPQFALIEKLVTLMKIPEIGIKRYEADDVIGSLVEQYKKDFYEVVIVTGDKDLMQFVCDDEKVSMLDTMKSKKYDNQAVFEKMGVWPTQIVDFLSMMGDSSDNIPGIRGIGAKGAAKLLGQYKDLDGIFENVDEVTNKRVLKGLTEHKEEGLLSKKLVQIVTDLDLPLSADELSYEFHVDDNLIEFLEGLSFKSTIAKLKELDQMHSQMDEGENHKVEELREIIVITNEDALNTFMSKCKRLNVFYELKDSEGIAAFYCLNDKDQYAKIMMNSALTTIGVAKALNSFGGVVEGEHLKRLMRSFAFHAQESTFKTFDLALAAFNLRADWKTHFELMTERYLAVAFTMPKLEEGLLQEKEVLDYDQKIAHRLELARDLGDHFRGELETFEVKSIFEELDTPAMNTLASMEAEGITLDISVLKKLEITFSDELIEIEEKIEKLSGEKINLRSPKQVGRLLFEVLEFPTIKKTKTGFSTSVEVLNELEKMVDSDVPSLIIKYRELDKLLSTYVKALPEVVNPETNKIHTHYQLTVASTGRLSSDSPNLQNIPTKTENGKLIRKAFIADEGNTFIAADYSQVELRILAHYCEDPTMVEAFLNDRDIHAQTASEIFGVPLEEMTSEVRSKAKAINFGLIYGQSSFGLAQALGISRKEAKEYIDHYFERFTKVKSFLETLKEDCRATGYARTLWGRKRMVSDINSSNHMTKSIAERVAINSPIQGTAADIIKKAMVMVDNKLRASGLDAKLLLQVHDELIVECNKSCADEVQRILVNEMESAAELRVPLKVDVGVGESWYELK